ncbi:YciI family protein [Variovorax dokdonensis]|uniref:YciI family protein n=1 Tax=Variovorax dokdonensis TaxID=344883 RepID=A0ABT7N905_9BURK|nr:YciI family protein [Variovorax dokdonensis]MDM0044429.1 YciI family protein [Variovorax dokdonensis]
MLFTLYCMDKPGGIERRLALRAVHREHVAKIADRLAAAGPLFADDGIAMIGSLLIVDFEDRAALDAWLADEPFTQQGVYETVTVRPFLNVWPQRTGAPPSDMSNLTAFAR